ncbi:hypothetical protein DFJ74DRAFT_100662 [Hyaloraphidium curvatum]|nr:hypothetical protein DFJ74DRAFT_100662 [Hyaloraphidium curvatum]
MASDVPAAGGPGPPKELPAPTTATYKVLWLLTSPLPLPTISALLPPGYAPVNPLPGQDPWNKASGHPLFLELGEEVDSVASGFIIGNFGEAKIEVPSVLPPGAPAERAAKWPGGAGLLYKLRIDMDAGLVMSSGARWGFGLDAYSSRISWTKDSSAHRYSVEAREESLLWRAAAAPFRLFSGAKPAPADRTVYSADLKVVASLPGVSFPDLEAGKHPDLPPWAAPLAARVRAATSAAWQPASSPEKVARHYYDYRSAKITAIVDGTAEFSAGVLGGKLPAKVAVRGVEVEIGWRSTYPAGFKEAGLE